MSENDIDELDTLGWDESLKDWELDLEHSFSVSEHYLFRYLSEKHTQFAHHVCTAPHSLREVRALYQESELAGRMCFMPDSVYLVFTIKSVRFFVRYLTYSTVAH